MVVSASQIPDRFIALNLSFCAQTNARLGAYAGLQNTWNQTSNAGGTIQLACDYTMAISNPPAEDKDKLGPSVAAIGYEFGDEQGRYEAWLDGNMPDWKAQPFAFWNAKIEAQTNVTTSSTGGSGSAMSNGSTTTTSNGTNTLSSNGAQGRSEISFAALTLLAATGLTMLERLYSA